LFNDAGGWREQHGVAFIEASHLRGSARDASRGLRVIQRRLGHRALFRERCRSREIAICLLQSVSRLGCRGRVLDRIDRGQNLALLYPLTGFDEHVAEDAPNLEAQGLGLS
jgi:hypothetical protein